MLIWRALRLKKMENAQQHWPILERLDTDLANKVQSFMVIGKDGKGVLMTTKDGKGFWLGEMWFGLNEARTAMEPTSLNVPGLVQMAQGYDNIQLLNKRGQIYSMGKNYRGQLGLGSLSQESHFLPQLISSQHKFISVRCGNFHSLALTDDGKVWSWGMNKSGQVGLPRTSEYLPSPRQITELDPYRIVAVECGGVHSLALTDQGEVYGWGANGWKEHSIGKIELKMFGTQLHTPTRLSTPSPVQSMAAGIGHTLLLTQSGEVYACGLNKYGQLGLPTITELNPRLSKVPGLPSITQIASHILTDLSIAMDHNHQCFVWGQLANGKSTFTPRKLPPFYSTVESPLSFFSTYCNTTHSVTLPAWECSRRADSTTQTEPGSDSVSDQASLTTDKRLLDRISQMFDNPDSCPDVRFQVENQIILAHRCVLQILSSHFRRFFSSRSANFDPPSSVTSTSQNGPSHTRHTTNPSNEPDTNSTTSQWPQVTVPIRDHSYPAFYAYLCFLYQGTFEVEPDNLAELFTLSVTYLECDLQQHCISRMRTTITAATCCLYYPLTHRHSLPELVAFQKELVQFASTKFLQVIGTPAYKSMKDELCKKLVIAVTDLQNL